MTPCAVKDCPGLATKGDYCAIHGTGLRLAKEGEYRSCQRCKNRIRKGVWFLEIGNGAIEHVKQCRKNDQK